MSNSRDETCGWVPTSNSAPSLRMHDRCEWSIINGLGNELWMCNIIWNRQLNMDRENIATIAPQIVMCSTRMSRIIIKQRVVFRLLRGNAVGAWAEREMRLQHLYRRHILFILKRMQCWLYEEVNNLFLLHLLLFSSVSVLLAFKLLGAWEHRLWWVTRCLSMFASFSKPAGPRQCFRLSLFFQSWNTTHTLDLLLTLAEYWSTGLFPSCIWPWRALTTDNPVGQD